MNRPKTISGEQANKLYLWLDGRYKIIFALAVQTGLRISDILRLKVKDLYNPMHVWESKSKRYRDVAVSNDIYAYLEKFAGHRSPDSFLFDSWHKSGVSVHRSTIHRHIKKALKFVNFDASAHSARKLYAQNVYKDTNSVEAVQKSLNHQKITTTLTYLDKYVELTAVGRLWYKVLKGIKNFFGRIFIKKVKK